MATIQRDTVLNALFTLLSSSSVWASTGRRLVHWTQAADQPAFFQRFIGETYEHLEAFGIPQIIKMHVECWIYAKSGLAEDTEAVFLPLLDALDTALASNATFDGRQDLGLPDYVHHCYRIGDATYSNGDLADQIICHIPLEIMVYNAFGSQ